MNEHNGPVFSADIGVGKWCVIKGFYLCDLIAIINLYVIFNNNAYFFAWL